MGLFENPPFEKFLEEEADKLAAKEKAKYDSVDHEAITQDLVLPEEVKSQEEQK